MAHLLRLLIVLGLALAVPVQGFAAVTAGQCMALGHHDSQRAGTGQAEAHDHDAAVQGMHGDAGVDAQQDSDGSSHCGPCVACCASASIAGPAPIQMAPAVSGVAYLFSPLSPPRLQPDGVDRPPLVL